MTTLLNVEKIPAGKKGNFEIRHEAGAIRLYEGDLRWMTSDEVEIDREELIALRCSGKVLVAGLGLGAIVELLVNHPKGIKSDVTEVVVVEVSQEVIDLVWKYIDVKGKAKIVCADIYDYLKQTKEKFDYIYFDIWPDKSEDSVKSRLNELAQKLVPEQNIFYWSENG